MNNIIKIYSSIHTETEKIGSSCNLLYIFFILHQQNLMYKLKMFQNMYEK